MIDHCEGPIHKLTGKHHTVHSLCETIQRALNTLWAPVALPETKSLSEAERGPIKIFFSIRNGAFHEGVPHFIWLPTGVSQHVHSGP